MNNSINVDALQVKLEEAILEKGNIQKLLRRKDDEISSIKELLYNLNNPISTIKLTDEYGNEYELVVRNYNPEHSYKINYVFLNYYHHQFMKYDDQIFVPLHGREDSGTMSYMDNHECMKCAMKVIRIEECDKYDHPKTIPIEKCKLIGKPKSKNVWIKISNDWYAKRTEPKLREVNIQCQLLPMFKSYYTIETTYDERRDRISDKEIYRGGLAGTKSNPFIVRDITNVIPYDYRTDPIDVYDGFLLINGEMSHKNNRIREDCIPFMNTNYKETWERLEKERADAKAKKEAEELEWERTRPQREKEAEEWEAQRKAKKAAYKKEHPKAHKYHQLTAEILTKEVWTKSTEKVAKDYGVSGRAIGKLCASLNVPKPPVGFWNKVHAGKIKQPNGIPVNLK